MVTLDWSEQELRAEVDRILGFISQQVGTDGKVVIGLSGGIDSDVTARLCARAIGPERMKCFTVLQDDFEDKYVQNASRLTEDLNIALVQLPMSAVPKNLIRIMAEADPVVGFRPDGLLDVARSKCALRTFIYSAYTERGYLIAGPSNRTEIELGYYLPFGDGLSHFSPIAHLYKTQVQQLAQFLGTRPAVREQQPAAGFWTGDSDLEGIAYWLYFGRPIPVEQDWTEAQEEIIHQIHMELSFRKLDTALSLLNEGGAISQVAEGSGLSLNTVERLAALSEQSRRIKNRPLSVRLS